MTSPAANRLAVAREMFGRGKFGDAERELRDVLLVVPDNFEAQVLLGVLFAKTKRSSEACEILENVLRQEPEQYDSLIWLAIVKKNLGEFDSALELCGRAIAAAPSNATGWNTMGVCYLSMRLPTEAIQALGRAIEVDPNSGPTYHNLGQALRLQENARGAREAFQRAVDLDPGNSDNHIELFKQCQWLSDWEGGIDCLERAHRKLPSSTAIAQALAAAYGRTKQPERARKLFDEILTKDPSAGQSYALWLQDQGLFEESAAVLEQSIRLNPLQGFAYYGLAEAKRFTLPEGSLSDQASVALEQEGLSSLSKMYLHYAMGKALDHEKRFEEAMRQFDKANESAHRIYIAGRSFDEAGLESYYRRIQTLFTPEACSRLRSAGSRSQKPILIVGMIRSGTTLLDQIVSNHHWVSSAGEQQFWRIEMERLAPRWSLNGPDLSDIPRLTENYLSVLENVAGGGDRITDKMPLNYEYLGMIHISFPEARIVHIRRSPLDTCLSIYMTHFGGAPSFAYNKKNIAAFYRCYLLLMEHWRAVLPHDRFLEIDYEDLVADREGVARKVVGFLGLPWDDACLAHEENVGPVHTPSRWQARQPIYNTSIERWRRYEPWLGELEELMNVGHPN